MLRCLLAVPASTAAAAAAAGAKSSGVASTVPDCKLRTEKDGDGGISRGGTAAVVLSDAERCIPLAPLPGESCGKGGRRPALPKTAPAGCSVIATTASSPSLLSGKAAAAGDGGCKPSRGNQGEGERLTPWPAAPPAKWTAVISTCCCTCTAAAHDSLVGLPLLPLPLLRGVRLPSDAAPSAVPGAAAAAAAAACRRLLRRACLASYCCTLKASSTLFLHNGHVQLRFNHEPMQSCMHRQKRHSEYE